MADIIEITRGGKDPENLITTSPLEFRFGDWQSGYAMMCTRGEALRYEAHRLEAYNSPGHQHIAFVPTHFSLEGGYHYTILALFRYRENEELMRRAYRLAGLMECVTNAPSPILRTDLLRRFYRTILEEREQLNVVWRGDVHHFLLPLHPERHNPNLFLQRIARAESLKELFNAIELETNTQLDILSRFYVFYVPESFLGAHPHRR